MTTELLQEGLIPLSQLSLSNLSATSDLSSEDEGRICSQYFTEAQLEELKVRLERQDSCESVGSIEDEGRPLQEPERASSVTSEDTSEGGPDSGIEAEKEPYLQIPEDDLIAKIVAQVEFYFSDANVLKDKFLLKHIRRNKEGFVSLKLVSSFKKVKQLTKDWRVVSYSLQKASFKIQINDQGSKIRRVDPLPEIEDDLPSTKAILALGLPLEKPGIEEVSQLFASCGEISFVRIVRAGASVPPDLKHYAHRHPALGAAHCAWLEFETPEAVKEALALSTEGGLQILPVVQDSQKKAEKQSQSAKGQAVPNSRKNSNPRGTYQVKIRKNSLVRAAYPEQEYPDVGNFHPSYKSRRKAVSLPVTQSPNLKDLSPGVERQRFRPKSKSCTEFLHGGATGASWVQRHLLAAAEASAASAASVVIGSRPPTARPGRTSQGSLPLPDVVVRFPRGPDGTKGFRREIRKQQIIPEEKGI